MVHYLWYTLPIGKLPIDVIDTGDKIALESQNESLIPPPIPPKLTNAGIPHPELKTQDRYTDSMYIQSYYKSFKLYKQRQK